MSIIQSADLEKRGLLHDQSSSLEIRGKWFKPGPSFRKSLRQTAIEFCNEAIEQKRQYILIEFPTYFMAWRRFIPKNVKPSPSSSPQVSIPSPDKLSLPSTRSSIQDIHSESLTHSEKGKVLQPSPAPIDDKFIAQCKVELAFHIGPMAEIVIENTLKQSEWDNPGKLIEALASYIQDSQASHSFALKLAEVIFSR